LGVCLVQRTRWTRGAPGQPRRARRRGAVPS
jgi:hypothetical protein